MAATNLHAVRLYRMDLPDHPCPWGLRALRLLQDQHIPFEDHRLISSEAVEAFKAAHGVTTTPQIFAGPERIGGYTELAARLGVRPETAEISYTPVVAVFSTAALMALALSAGVSGFMGIAICLLAMLKLMDMEAFAASFHKYDLLSQRWWALGCCSNPSPPPLPSWWERWPFCWVPWAWCRWARPCSSITWRSTAPAWVEIPEPHSVW